MLEEFDDLERVLPLFMDDRPHWVPPPAIYMKRDSN